MTTKPKTPAAVGAASGGDRDVLAGAERLDHSGPPGAIIRPNYWTQDAWLRQVSGDTSQGNAAFRAAWAVSTLLRQNDGATKATLQTIGVVAGLRGKNGETAMFVRRGLNSLEQGGHLLIDKSAGRGPGNGHRYELILKEQQV